MGELKNLTKKEVDKIIKKFPLVPMRGKVIVTINVIEEEDLNLKSTSLDEVQYIIATDEYTDLKSGTKVLLDLTQLTEYKTADDNTMEKFSRIKIDPILVDNTTYAMINMGVIKARFK